MTYNKPLINVSNKLVKNGIVVVMDMSSGIKLFLN